MCGSTQTDLPRKVTFMKRFPTPRNPVRSTKILAATWLACIAWFSWGSTALAQNEVFMKFTTSGSIDVIGDSTDVTYPGSSGWFRVTSFQMGATNSQAYSGSGAATGRTGFTEMESTKTLGLSSPGLFRALTTGAAFPTAQLVVRKSGGSSRDAAYATFDFKSVYVTGQYLSANASDPAAAESIQMIYAAIRISVRPQNPDGSFGAAVVGMWDQVANRASF